jgi:hypothetical protein
MALVAVMLTVALAIAIASTATLLVAVAVVLVMALALTGIGELAVAVLATGGTTERPSGRSAAGDGDRAASPAKQTQDRRKRCDP